MDIACAKRNSFTNNRICQSYGGSIYRIILNDGVEFFGITELFLKVAYSRGSSSCSEKGSDVIIDFGRVGNDVFFGF